MQRNKAFSILTIVCFCSIIFIPIGLVTMWFSTDWKKKTKFIFSGAFTVLYAIIVALLLLLEPSYNTRGVSLPISYGAGETAYETSITTKGKDAEDVDGDTESKKKKKTDEQQEPEEHLPRSLKKSRSAGSSRTLYSILFFLFMLFLVIWQNYRAKNKKSNYENPYVDTNKYKLPLSEDAKMPMVHFLKLRLSVDEKIYYATETTQKDNQGDFVVTNKRVVVFSKEGDYEFPFEALTAVSSVTNTVMLLTCGERKYYIFMPEGQLKYALAVVRWAYSKVSK